MLNFQIEKLTVSALSINRSVIIIVAPQHPAPSAVNQVLFLLKAPLSLNLFLKSLELTKARTFKTSRTIYVVFFNYRHFRLWKLGIK